MAHWAEVDTNGIVTRVLVMPNNADEGYTWLTKTFGGTWVKTSYNTYAGQHRLGGTPLRKNFAGVGYSYDAERDAFIAPQPYGSWVLDEETCLWNAPVAYPTDGKNYDWDEETTSWVEAVAE